MRKTLWIALLVLWPPLLFAQQPFYADDADVTPAGKVHFEGTSMPVHASVYK